MTAITFVGANAGVSGNNTSLTPTIHASAVAGDLMLLFASIRSTSAVVGTPTGWQPVMADGNVALFQKTHSGVESAPTVSFTGGAAGADTLAQIGVYRTATAYRRNLTAISNAAAQNITLPASTLPGRNNSLVLYFGWKQDDWTTIGTVAPVVVGTVVSTAGLDAAQVWNHEIQTTATASAVGFFTVTGGAAAVSKAFLVVLDQQAFITAAVQDSYPPRVLISVTNLVVGDAVELYRVVGGVRTLVRAGSDPSVGDTSFLRIDAELPFGTPVFYVAVVSGAEVSTSPVTYTLPGGKVALSDAVGGLAAEVVVTAWPEKGYGRDSTSFRVGGRNVVVSGDLTGYSSTIELYVEATSARDSVFALLEDATEGVVQIRQPGGYDGVDSYVAVLAATERRHSQDGTDQRRIIALDVEEVEPWADSLEARGFTLQDLADLYAGLTLADLAGDYTTLLELAQADLS